MRYQEISESFNKCYTKACKLYDRAEAQGKQPKLIQVAGYLGDTGEADLRWQKLPPHVWQHYVTVVGDTVFDPTAKQFGPNRPEKYSYDILEKEWNKLYVIKPKHSENI